MPVHDLSYAHYGGRRDGGSPVAILARAQIRAVLRRRTVRFLLLAATGFTLAWIALVYLESHALRSGPLARLAGVIEVDARSFRNFVVFQRLVHLLLFLALADLIAVDRRHRALQIYLARPLGAFEYVAAKWLALAALLSATTWLPGWLLIIVKTVLRGDASWLGPSPWLPLSLLGYAACLVVPLGMLTLAVSSLSRSARQASATLFAVLLLSTAVGQALAALTRHDAWQLLSLQTCFDQLASGLFGTPSRTDLPSWSAVLVLAAVSGISAVVLRARVRAVDVVGGV